MTLPRGDFPTPSRPPIAEVVRREMSVVCFDRRGQEHELEVEFAFEAADPYAIMLSFPTHPESEPWRFARSLLSRGVCEPSGCGDVHIWPSLDREGRAIVGIRLSSPGGELTVEARSSQVYAFVRATLALVPAGTESSRLDMDELVSRLLTA